MTDSPITKEEARVWATAVRETLDWEGLSAPIVEALAAWPPLTNARTVLLFLPMADEVNLNPLIERDPGPRFVATRTPDVGALTVHELGGPLEVHRYGFLQPHATAPVVRPEEVDVFLLPGLAFDLYGTRLGRGAGYFDRLLPHARRGAVFAGVVPAALVLDRLPHEEHDISVAYLASEEGVIEVVR